MRFCNQKNVNVNAICQAWRYRKNVRPSSHYVQNLFCRVQNLNFSRLLRDTLGLIANADKKALDANFTWEGVVCVQGDSVTASNCHFAYNQLIISISHVDRCFRLALLVSLLASYWILWPKDAFEAIFWWDRGQMYHQLDVLLRNREIRGSSKEAVEVASLRKPDWPIVNVQNCENEVEMTKKKTRDPSTYFIITCTSKTILDAIVDASGKVVGVMTSCCVFAFQDDASTCATNPKRSVMTALLILLFCITLQREYRTIRHRHGKWRRLLHAVLNFRYFECSYNIGWADLSAACCGWFIFWWLHRFHEEFLFASCSPGAGTRPEVLGHENLNKKTPSELLVTASTNCNFLPSGSMDVMDLLDFFSPHWLVSRSLEIGPAGPKTESEIRSCWFCWSPTFECTRPRKTKDVKIWKSCHPEAPPVW